MPQSPTLVPQLAVSSAIGFGVPITVSATARTLAASDLGKLIQFTSASAVTLTIPADATVNFPIGRTAIPFQQAGAGKITVVAAAGVTLNAASGLVHSNAQYSILQLIKMAANNWTLIGDRS